MGAFHRLFRAGLTQFLFTQAGDDDGQFMGGQAIGVMQDRCYRQVFTANGTIYDDLQSLDRGKHTDRSPIAAGAIMILD